MEGSYLLHSARLSLPDGVPRSLGDGPKARIPPQQLSREPQSDILAAGLVSRKLGLSAESFKAVRSLRTEVLRTSSNSTKVSAGQGLRESPPGSPLPRVLQQECQNPERLFLEFDPDSIPGKVPSEEFCLIGPKSEAFAW